MKKILIMALAMVGFSAWGQQGRVADFVRVDTILNFTSELSTLGARITHNCWNDTYAFTNFKAYHKNDTVVVYTINTSTYKVDTLEIFCEGICKYMRKTNNSQITAMAINDRYLVLGLWRMLVVFEQHDGVYDRSESIPYNKDYGTLQFVDDHTLLSSKCYHGGNPPTHLVLFDLEKKAVVAERSPYVNSTLMSLLRVSNLVVPTKNGFLWAHPSEYSFVEYDRDMVLRDSTHCPTDRWVTLRPETLKKVAAVKKHHPADMTALMIPEWKGLDLIVNIQMLDEDHLMVIRQTGSTDFSMVDIWSRQEGRWTRTRNDLHDGGWYADKDSVITRNNYVLGHPFGDRINATGGKIVSISPNGCVMSPLGMTVEEYQKERYDRLVEGDHFIQVRIYSHKF